jgi:hypothetical protein
MPEDIKPSNAEATGNFDVASHATPGSGSDEDGDSDEDDDSEDDSEEGEINELDYDDEDHRDDIEYLWTAISQGDRAARRGPEHTSTYPYARPPIKRKRIVCSESRSPSTERPERSSTNRPRPAALTNTNTNNNTSTDRPPTLAGNSTPPIPQNTPQPAPVETTRLTSASEAGTSGTPREVHRERALAKKQLEWTKIKNRAAELEAHNRADEMKQEIEFEARFGDVLGD